MCGIGMNDILLEQRFWFRYFDYETFTKHSMGQDDMDVQHITPIYTM